MLCDIFVITVLCNDSKLYTASEFDKRLKELNKIFHNLNIRKDKSIEIVVYKYKHEDYMKDLTPFAEQKEGGERCRICYRKCMVEAMKYASKNNYYFFTT